MRNFLSIAIVILACIFFVSGAQGQKNIYKATIDKDGIQRAYCYWGQAFSYANKATYSEGIK